MHSEGDDGRPGAALCTRGLDLFWLLGDTPDPWHVLQQGPVVSPSVLTIS